MKMPNPSIVVIDPDKLFLVKFKSRLEELGLSSVYDFVPIQPENANPIEAVEYCANEIKKLVKEGLRIEVVFVDVVIFEDQDPPEDRTGLEIAKRIRTILPGIPIAAWTRYIKAHRMLTEVSFDCNVQGVLIKRFMLEDKSFSRKDFLDLLARAKERIGITSQASEEVALPLTTQEFGEMRFAVDDDARCKHQAEQIGKHRLMALLGKLFPFSQGTVSYMRPGFSGSYLFKATVKSAPPGTSASGPRIWAVKISEDPWKLDNELAKCKALRTRVRATLYPQVLNDGVTRLDRLGAIALEMQADATTLFEHMQRAQRASEVVPLVSECLVTFLRDLYGDPVRKQTFVWKSHFDLNNKAKSAILTFLGAGLQPVLGHLGQSGQRARKRIEAFVASDAKTEEAISKLETEVETRYIHGDLNSRNILVNSGAPRLTFIDFANNVQDHCMKDVAKLETDYVFLVMDSADGKDTEWSRLKQWRKILKLYSRGNILRTDHRKNSKQLPFATGIIRELRQVLPALGVMRDETQYLVALLYYALHHLSYSDVTIQKRVFGILYVNHLLESLKQFQRV
ncbi:MAG: phosphotransferase [Terriglobia bacterium]